MRKTLFFLLLLVPAGLSAQMAPHPQRFELTPVVGYRLSSDFSAATHDLFDDNVDIDESESFGLLFDIPLGEMGWKLELLANRQPSTLVASHGLLTPTHDLGDINLDTYQVGLLYQWGPGQVEPFVVFAGGITHLDPEFPGSSSDTRLSGSFGGGVKIFFSQNVGLRLEGRGYWTDLSDSNFDDDHHHHDDDWSDEGLFQGEGSIGLILAW